MRSWLALLPLLAASALAADEAPANDAPAPPSVEVREEGALRFEGCPVPEPELAARLNQYQEMRSAGFRGFDPAGGVFIATRFGDVAQAHHVAMPDGARTQLTFGEEPIRSIQPHPSEPDRVLLTTDLGGNEAYQFELLTPSTGDRVLLTDGTSRHGGIAWSDDPSRPNAVLYTGTGRNGKDYDIYRADVTNPAGAERIFEGEGYAWVADWDAATDTIIVGKYVSSTESRVYVLEDGALRGLTPEGEVSAGGGVLTPDASTAYVVSDHEGQFKQLYAVDVASGAMTRLPIELQWGVDDFALSPDGRTLAFTVNERGWARVYLYDTKKQTVRKPASLPDAMFSRLQFHPDNPRILGMSVYGADRTSDIYTLDIKKDRATRWTHSEMAGLSPEDFVAPRPFTWKSFDGLELDGFTYQPEGEGPFPVVIAIHGGPEGQSRPGLASTYQVLAAEGIAVVVPNVRGSAGYGKDFIQLDNGFKREDSVKDIGALLDWIDAQDALDGSRVAVRGGSYGGYMVLASLFHFNDRLVGGIDVVGISNFVTFLENTKAYRRDLRRVEYGDERDPKMREHLLAISPTNHVDELLDPLMVIHGANDPRVPVGEAEQIVAAVRNNGQEVCYLLASNEGHGFRKKANREVSQVLEVQFLRRLLLK